MFSIRDSHPSSFMKCAWSSNTLTICSIRLETDSPCLFDRSHQFRQIFEKEKKRRETRILILKRTWSANSLSLSNPTNIFFISAVCFELRPCWPRRRYAIIDRSLIVASDASRSRLLSPSPRLGVLITLLKADYIKRKKKIESGLTCFLFFRKRWRLTPKFSFSTICKYPRTIMISALWKN